MNYLKGYKPVELNKGDLKTLDRFSDLEAKDNKVIDEFKPILENKDSKGAVFALRNKKEKKYKSIYIFKPEKNEDGKDILKFYKSVTTEEVSKETIKEFEDIIIESLKEEISLDETWKQVLWNDNIIEPRTIRIGSINLSTGLLGILLGTLLYIITGEIIWFTLGLCVGLAGGAVVTKIGDKKEEQSEENKEREKNKKKDKKNKKDNKDNEEENSDE